MSDFAGQGRKAVEGRAEGAEVIALSTWAVPAPGTVHHDAPRPAKSGTYTDVADVVSPTARAGVWGPTHDSQWFDRVHVIPRRADVGAIVGNRILHVDVWNAWRSGLKLTSIPVTGPTGVSVSAGSLPRKFLPFHLESHTINVAGSGPATINNLVTWVFGTLVEAGIDFTVTGLREMLFTAAPDGSTEVQEIYGYETDVMTAWDGTEQRTQLRELVTRSLRFSVTFDDATDSAEAMGKILATGGNTFVVPLWPDATPLAVLAPAGASVLYLATAGRGFAAGGTLLILRDQWTYEAAVVDQVFSDHVTLTGVLASAWVDGSIAVPTLTARLLSQPTLNRLEGNGSTLDVEFSWEAA